MFPRFLAHMRSRTDGGGLDHVADGESLNGLVLRRASRAVGASDRLDVAAALLVASAAKLVSPEFLFSRLFLRTWKLASSPF